MNPTLRVIVPVAILLAMAYYVNVSINRLGTDMADKTQRDGIQSQIRYHQSTLRDTAQCAAYRTPMDKVANAQTASDAGNRLLAISAEARSKDCLK